MVGGFGDYRECKADDKEILNSVKSKVEAKLN